MDLRLRRIEILRRVETGELSPEDGNRLLLELEEREAEAQAAPIAPIAPVQAVGIQAESDGTSQAVIELPAPSETSSSTPPLEGKVEGPPSDQPGVEEIQSPKTDGWRGLWVLPFLLGLLLTLFSVNWMYQGFVSAGLSWGFWLSFIPFAIGILLMWAGWETRLARWLHLRIRRRPGSKPPVIAFSLPLPFGLTRWVVQRFGRFTPQVNGQDAADVIDELDQAFATDGPTHVFVDDAEGEQVEIWIDGPTRK